MSLLKDLGRNAVEPIIRSSRFSRWFFEDFARKDVLCYREFGDHRLVFDPSETIGRRIYEGGGFAQSETGAVLDTVAKCRKGGAFLEIGANIGTQTVYAHLSGNFDRIVAIEPDPANFGILKTNAMINGMETAELFGIGLSDQARTARLSKTRWNSGASTLEGHLGEDGSSQVEVALEVGDEFLDRIGLAADDISMIWMDVERHEAPALAGLQRTLDAQPILYFEFSLDQPSPDGVERIDQLVFSTYPHLYLENDGLRPTTRDDLLALARSKSGHANVLASPEPLEL